MRSAHSTLLTLFSSIIPHSPQPSLDVPPFHATTNTTIYTASIIITFTTTTAAVATATIIITTVFGATIVTTAAVFHFIVIGFRDIDHVSLQAF